MFNSPSTVDIQAFNQCEVNHVGFGDALFFLTVYVALHAVSQVCGGDVRIQHHPVGLQGALQGTHSETAGDQ